MSCTFQEQIPWQSIAALLNIIRTNSWSSWPLALQHAGCILGCVGKIAEPSDELFSSFLASEERAVKHVDKPFPELCDEVTALVELQESGADVFANQRYGDVLMLLLAFAIRVIEWLFIEQNKSESESV